MSGKVYAHLAEVHLGIGFLLPVLGSNPAWCARCAAWSAEMEQAASAHKRDAPALFTVPAGPTMASSCLATPPRQTVVQVRLALRGWSADSADQSPRGAPAPDPRCRSADGRIRGCDAGCAMHERSRTK